MGFAFASLVLATTLASPASLAQDIRGGRPGVHPGVRAAPRPKEPAGAFDSSFCGVYLTDGGFLVINEGGTSASWNVVGSMFACVQLAHDNTNNVEGFVGSARYSREMPPLCDALVSPEGYGKGETGDGSFAKISYGQPDQNNLITSLYLNCRPLYNDLDGETPALKKVELKYVGPPSLISMAGTFSGGPVQLTLEELPLRDRTGHHELRGKMTDSGKTLGVIGRRFGSRARLDFKQSDGNYASVRAYLDWRPSFADLGTMGITHQAVQPEQLYMWLERGPNLTEHANNKGAVIMMSR